MKVVFRRAAEKALQRISADRRRQILSRIKEVAENPNTRNIGVKQLSGSDLFRLRVGNYRVLFTLDESETVLTIELIRPRGDVYKR
jgi:mRNA interferase RelE/StbE